MDGNVDLGAQLEQAVTELVESGRYDSRNSVLRAGVALVRAREARLAEFDAAIDESVVDADAGRTIDAEALFDELLEQYSTAPRAAE